MTQLSNLFYIDATGERQQATATMVIAAARQCMDEFLRRDVELSSPALVKDFLAIKLGQRTREIFAVIFLDCQNRVIEYREMFRGTLTTTSVYPREIVKVALQLNAAAAVICHNHPSTGIAMPSNADQELTKVIKATLALVDVHVQDHVIVGGGTVFSFAEQGLM